MSKFGLSVLLWVVGFPFSTTYPQEIPDLSNYVELDAARILKNRRINAVLQDPHGFIWIATYGDAFRFDGVELQPMFKGDFEDIELDTSLSTLILTHRNGCYFYNYANGDTTHVSAGALNLIAPDMMASISLGDSNILIGHRDGITQYDMSTGLFVFHQFDNKMDKRLAIHDIVRDPNDKQLIWAGTNSGIFQFCLDNHHLKQITFPVDSRESKAINTITCILPHANKLYLGTWHAGVIIYDPERDDYEQLFVENRSLYPNRDPIDHIYAIVPDKQGKLWFSSTVGAIYFDPGKQKTLYHVSAVHPVEQKDLGPQIIDRDGKLWCGYTYGLKVVEKRRANIQNLRLPDSNNLNWHIPEEVVEVDGHLYFCLRFSDGLYHLDLAQNSWHILKPQAADPSAGFNGLSMVYHDGTLWILEENGLYMHTPGTRFLRKVNIPGLEKYRFVAFTNVDTNLFWLSTRNNGVVELDIKTSLLRQHDQLNELLFSKARERVRFFYKDKYDQIWMGTSSTVLLRTITNNYRDLRPALPGNQPLNIVDGCESSQHFWISTYKGVFGIALKHEIEDTFYRVYDEIATNIATPEDQHLWLTTDQTITHINLSTNDVLSYTKDDGLLHPGRYMYESLDWLPGIHKMITGGRRIFSLFDPKTISINQEIPQPYLMELQINGVPVRKPWTPGKNHHLILKPGQNSLSLKFSGIVYNNPETTEFRYKLEGVEDRWQYADIHRRNVTYTNLNGGDYKFLIQARNTNGVWSVPQELSLTIKAFYWQRTWFQILFILLVLGGIFGIYRRRIRDVYRKNEMQQKVMDLEKQALRAQMNPHFIFNAMNSIQYLISRGEKNRASLYLSQFASLLRMILETSFHSEIPLSKELKMLEDFLALESLRLNHSFSYSIEIDPSLQSEDCLVPALLLQPFVENAIQHGLANKQEHGSLSIQCKDQEDHIFCLIEDNGIGRAAASRISSKTAEAKSRGIFMARQRLLHFDTKGNNSTVKIIDKTAAEGFGTRVEIKIPFKAIPA